MYPTGWTEVSVPGAADVVFHDIINDSENVSVVVSGAPEGISLEDLGTPTEVGYKLSKSINALAKDERDVELLSAVKLTTFWNMLPHCLQEFATIWLAWLSDAASCLPLTHQLGKSAGKKLKT